MPAEATVDLRERAQEALTFLLVLCALASLALIVAVVGWEHTGERLTVLGSVARLTLLVFGLAQWARLAVARDHWRWLRQRWPALAFGAFALAESASFGRLLFLLEDLFPAVPARVLVLALVGGSQAPVLVSLALRFVRLQDFFAERSISPGLVLMITFGALIAVGTLLLKLPRATPAGISWLDALFTSTSAVCVTGLIVVDTETAFTPLGKTVVLMLFQLGGLGVMTLTTFLAQFFGGVSLRGRVLVQDLISEDNVGRITRTLPLIFALTVAFEVLGTIAIYASFEPGAELRSGAVFAALFHSVSAFCNAGFSTWSGGLYDPAVRANTWLQIIVMLLIVAGGLGFPAWAATVEWLQQGMRRLFGRSQRRPTLALHARMVWISTLVLIAAGALLIGFAEYGLGDQPHDTPVIVASLFHSITARTAGFNVAPVEFMTPAAVSVLVLLMFIGGSPGGTAGGVKTTAFAVALLNVRRILLARSDVEAFGRRLPDEAVSRAMGGLVLAFVWAGVATTLLALFEPHTPLADLVFEAVSALSTVGLSRGITSTLNPAGKLVIIVTMFVGRVGVLYCVLAFLGRRRAAPLRYPEENVYVT